MEFTAFIVCCILASAQAFVVQTVDDVPEVRIFGGTVEAKNAKRPWMVFIQIIDATETTKIFTSCSGAIVSGKTIITSGACLSDLTPGGAQVSRVKVYLGDVDPLGAATPVTPSPVFNYTINPNFYSNSNEFDIGIITLTNAVTETDNIRFINMPTKNVISKPDNFAGKKAIAYGWGATEPADTPVANKFSFVPMTIMAQQDCIIKMATEDSYAVFDSMVCTDTDKSKSGICRFDSGGPLTIQLPSATMPTLYAIASYYDACSTLYPNIFTRLGAKDVLKWIAANGGPPEPK